MRGEKRMKTIIAWATGLWIRTATGLEFVVDGPVSYQHFDEDGVIYYCAGRSFMEGCVAEVLKI